MTLQEFQNALGRMPYLISIGSNYYVLVLETDGNRINYGEEKFLCKKNGKPTFKLSYLQISTSTECKCGREIEVDEVFDNNSVLFGTNEKESLEEAIIELETLYEIFDKEAKVFEKPRMHVYTIKKIMEAAKERLCVKA